MRYSICIVIAVWAVVVAAVSSHAPVRAESPAAATIHAVPFIDAKTIIIVRHADTQKGAKKAKGNKLAPLAVPGMSRAADLAVALKDEGVTTLVASDCLRTQQTLQKLSTVLGLKIDTTLKHGDETEPAVDAPPTVDANKSLANEKEAAAAITHLAEIAHPSDVVVLCYHHNVIPLILADLGFKDEPAFASGEYDRLYVITPDPRSHTYHVSRLHYGQKDYAGDKAEEAKP
jgi:phosphohistidine phosphatase SixA